MSKTTELVEAAELRVGDAIIGNGSRRWADVSTVEHVERDGEHVTVRVATKKNGRHRVRWNESVELEVIR